LILIYLTGFANTSLYLIKSVNLDSLSFHLGMMADIPIRKKKKRKDLWFYSVWSRGFAGVFWVCFVLVFFNVLQFHKLE